MSGTSKGGKKAAAKLLAKDPDHFKKLQSKSKKPRGGKASPGSFKPGNPYAAKGGKASKRGPGKKVVVDDTEFEAGHLQYEEASDA